MRVVFFSFLIYSKILFAQDSNIEEYRKQLLVETKECQKIRLKESASTFLKLREKTVHSVLYRPPLSDATSHVTFTLFITYSPPPSLFGSSKSLPDCFSMIPKNHRKFSAPSLESLPTFGGKHALFSPVMMADRIFYTASSAILQCTKKGIPKHFQQTIEEIFSTLEEHLRSTYHILKYHYKKQTYIDWTDFNNIYAVRNLMDNLFPENSKEEIVRLTLEESPYVSLLSAIHKNRSRTIHTTF